MLGSGLSNAVLNDMGYTRLALGTTGGSVTINYAVGTYQTMTTNAATSLAFTNFTAAGTQDSISVQITVASVAHTVTFPSAVSVNTTGIPGLNTTTNTITFASVGVYAFEFITSNGGTTVTVNEINKKLQPFNNSQEDLAPSAAISLATTVSYFTTAGAETATLADGVEGQIKTLICKGYVGNMVVTVASPGWGGAGTITFGAAGQACTLQYVQGDWYCIGNNAAVFA
jgi:hypothetical protein